MKIGGFLTKQKSSITNLKSPTSSLKSREENRQKIASTLNFQAKIFYLENPSNFLKENVPTLIIGWPNRRR